MPLVVVVVIAQQLFSYRQLSRLRKSATSAGLSHRSCTVSYIGWLWQLNRCSMECGVTDIRYVAGDAGLVTVQKPTVTRTQPGESGTDWPRQQTSLLTTNLRWCSAIETCVLMCHTHKLLNDNWIQFSLKICYILYVYMLKWVTLNN